MQTDDRSLMRPSSLDVKRRKLFLMLDCNFGKTVNKSFKPETRVNHGGDFAVIFLFLLDKLFAHPTLKMAMRSIQLLPDAIPLALGPLCSRKSSWGWRSHDGSQPDYQMPCATGSAGLHPAMLALAHLDDLDMPEIH